MAIYAECPYCGSIKTEKSTKGKISRGLSIAGSIVGGALLQMTTGVPGILGANLGSKVPMHQYLSRECGETFKNIRADKTR